MPRLPFVAAAALIAFAVPAHAEPGIAITIYSDNQALVQDTRSVTFTGERQKVEFKNVSAQIRPETATLNSAGMHIFEQNFDYDLLSPAKIMENAVGQTITLVRTNPATGAETREQAVVLAANGGVVLQIGTRIEVLRDDGLPVRVIFDKVPPNMRADPTLSMTLQAPAGTREAALRYLTPGLGWRADYVALFDEAKEQIDVQGWVTLTNNSGVNYDNADTVLVAGTPKLIGRYNDQQGLGTMIEAGTESGTRGRLGDYYLYPLADRTTIANMQTKQVSFLDVKSAPATHGYEVHFGWLQNSTTPLSVQTMYQFSTSAKGGLGDQLPAGIVRFYLRDSQGQPQFIGEHAIANTPMGSRLSINTGEAFDVKVQPIMDSRTRINSNRWKTAMRYILTNALPKPVKVQVVQDGLYGDTRIPEQSQQPFWRDADRAAWLVEVPAGGKTELTATFDTRY
jgi:hypothetical protein